MNFKSFQECQPLHFASSSVCREGLSEMKFQFPDSVYNEKQLDVS